MVLVGLLFCAIGGVAKVWEEDFDDNWGLDDPTGKSDEEFKKIIKAIDGSFFVL